MHTTRSKKIKLRNVT